MPQSASSSKTECLLCNGAGFLRTDMPLGATGFGVVVPCRCAVEAAERELWQNTWRRAFQDASLGDLPPSLREHVRVAVAARRGLYLWGANGVGKTHTAFAVLRELSHGPAAAMLVADLLTRLRAGVAPDAPLPADAILNSYIKMPCLLLDDMGAERCTEWVQEQLFRLIYGREGAERLTIITSNLSLDGLAEFYPDSGFRIRSRIAGMCDVIELRPPGGDRRLRRG